MLIYIFEEFGDTKLVIISCKSKKCRQYNNDEMKKDRQWSTKHHTGK